MKRDMDLVRELLLRVEEDRFDAAFIDNADADTKYHIHLLIEQKWLERVLISQTIGASDPVIVSGRPQLSWDGHEFLETIRQKTVWEKIKKLIDEKGVGLSIDGIKIAAPLVVKSMLGPG